MQVTETLYAWDMCALTRSKISLWNIECTPMMKGVGELNTSRRREGRIGMYG